MKIIGILHTQPKKKKFFLCLLFILSGTKKNIMKTECEKKNYLQLQ